MRIPNYEQMVEDFYTRQLRPGDVCIDVGAHRGRHTLPMARVVGPQGVVYAFEPLEGARDQLREAIAHYDPNAGLARIEISKVALSDETGVASFVSVEEYPEYSGFKERVYDHDVHTTIIWVTTDTLDNLTPQLPKIAYMKIDSEGGEYQILRGAQQLMLRDCPLITFEFGDNSIINYDFSSADMYQLLADCGYRVFDILGRSLDRETFCSSSAEQKVWDYIAVSEQRINALDQWAPRMVD